MRKYERHPRDRVADRLRFRASPSLSWFRPTFHPPASIRII